MIPGSKAPKAVRACTKGFELGILKNIKKLRELCTKELSKLLCMIKLIHNCSKRHQRQLCHFKMLQTKRNTDYGDTHDAAP